MQIASFPIQYNGFFIFDSMSLMRYAKKGYKGRVVAYLKPSHKNNKVIDFKFLKKLELMSLDFLFSQQDKMQPSLKLLRKGKDVKKLALHHLIKEDHDLLLLYKMLKRYKLLTSLELNTINRSEKITDKGLFWLRKILRLTKNIQAFSYSGLRQNMTESAICRSFSLLPSLASLKKINLEICLTSKFAKALDLLCSLLSLCFSLRSVSLVIKYYDTVYDDTFKSIFAPLAKVKYLKEVSVYVGVYNYKINYPTLATKSLCNFLENNSFLEVFSLDMRLEQALPLRFPLEKAKNLRKLVLYFKESKCLYDSNFELLAGSIRQCKHLKEFSINLSRCNHLTDASIKKLCDAIVNLQELKVLVLLLGDKIIQANNLSAKAVQHIGTALTQFKKLSELDLSLSNLCNVTDFEVEQILQGVSENKNLKELKLDLSFSKVTDRGFEVIGKSLNELHSLETLEFDLDSCNAVSSRFLSSLTSVLLDEENKLKNLHKVMVNLTSTLVSKEHTTAAYASLKQRYPKCYLSLYIR